MPDVDTLLMLRPTESPTLFLQQLGRGLRKAPGKTSAQCSTSSARTARSSASTGGSARCSAARARRRASDRDGFPFLPAGCSLELDPVAREIVLRSIRDAIPSAWRERCDGAALARRREARRRTSRAVASSSRTSTPATTAGPRCVARSGLPTAPAGPDEAPLLRAVGRLLHVDDDERIDATRGLLCARQSAVAQPLSPARAAALPDARRVADGLECVGELRGGRRRHLGNIRRFVPNCSRCSSSSASRVPYVDHPLGLPGIPLALHARYTRAEILAAFGVGEGAKPPTWQTGVWWDHSRRPTSSRSRSTRVSAVSRRRPAIATTRSVLS